MAKRSIRIAMTCKSQRIVDAAGVCCLILLYASSYAQSKTIIVEGRDSAAIQQAINRAGTDDVVQLPAGVYSVTANISLRSHLHLIGAVPANTAASQTILEFHGDTAIPFISCNKCEDIELTDLILDGKNNPLAIHGIVPEKSQRLHFNRLTIRNLAKGKDFGPIGIYCAAGVSDSTIENCNFENIGVGATYGGGIRMAYDSSRNKILNNTIRSTGRGGIHADDGCTDLVISGNTVAGSGGEGLGIEVWKGCDRALIEDNHIDHWLSLDTSSGSAVRRNVITDPGGAIKFAGIELVDNSHDCVFTDNLVDGGQSIGLSESGKRPKERVFWGYNRFLNIPGWGAEIQGEEGGAARQYFYRCQFTGALAGKSKYPDDDGNGFRINDHVKFLTFEECEFSNNARQGVQILGEADGLMFLKCGVIGNGGDAFTGPEKYATLECADCVVMNNKGSNELPKAKPFPGRPPSVDFDVPKLLHVGQGASFSASSPAAAGIKSWLWDFNDGLPAVEKNAVHAFQSPGKFRVTLIAWDTAGRAGRIEKTVTVVSAPAIQGKNDGR
jgi:parallel beta-helix repeat protein